MNIKYQSLKLLGFVLLLFTFTFLLFTFTTPVYASSHCKSEEGKLVPPNNQATNPPGTNHVYTGSKCGAIRTSPGSIIGPGQFGDPQYYRCLGACIYEVNYCTYNDGCEATYSVRDCPTAPARCNNPNTATSGDIGTVFGKIIPPDAIINFGFGASGISKFLSNLVVLFYSVAIIVLILMILWGAFDWITSEGDKEKLDSARRKLINAVIGIMLFAVAFAIIQILGTFTGFKFFEGQQ